MFNINTLLPANAKSVLDQLAATGLPIYSSEFDANGWSEDNQAVIYERILSVIWEHPAVHGVTIWGYITGETWRYGTGILDSDGNQRKAFKWLVDYIPKH